MAILNFPPTAGEPIDGSFTYSSDGVTYSWDGYKWTADTGSGGGGDANHSDGPTPPTTGELADQWYNTDDGRLYTYTADSSGTLVWIDASPDSIAGGSGGSGDGTTVNYNGASAWGVFDGTTLNLEGSQNIASVVRNSPGNYSVTFITPMPTASYSVVLGAGSIGCTYSRGGKVPTGFDVYTYDNNNAETDADTVSFAVYAENAIAPQSGVGADAWGTCDTNGITQSGFNLTSSKVSNGVYDWSFIQPMPSNKYAVNATGISTSTRFVGVSGRTTTGFRTTAVQSNGSAATISVAVTVHASSTVTPTYTWTRDGTTLKPANDGDDVSVGKFTGSTTGLTGYSFQYDVDGLARFAFGEQNIGGNDVGYMRYQHLTGGGSTNYTDVFQSNNDLKISTAGVVGIGSGASSNITLSGSGNFSASATGNPSSNGYNFAVGDGGTGATPEMVIRSAAGANTNVALSIQNGNVGQVQLDLGGNIRAVNTSGIQPIVSERRFKQNIEDFDAAACWETTKNIAWHKYEYKSKPGVTYTGHIVDEVQAVDSSLVIPSTLEGEDALSYDNSTLNAMRFVALQTALTRIETLEETNASLEARLTALEGGNN